MLLAVVGDAGDSTCAASSGEIEQRSPALRRYATGLYVLQLLEHVLDPMQRNVATSAFVVDYIVAPPRGYPRRCKATPARATAAGAMRAMIRWVLDPQGRLETSCESVNVHGQVRCT